MAHKNIHHKSSLKNSVEHHTDTKNGFSSPVSILIALLGVTLWSYWPVIVSLFKDWQINEDYSAGQLVPLVAIFLVWHERKRLKECRLKPFWWAIILILIALAGRAYGLLFMYESAERYSLVLVIAGLVMMVFGWQVFRRLVWIFLFLLLMVPFPGQIHNMISSPLRTMATTGSVFILEAFINVGRNGNVLTLNGSTTLGIEEACSGLRMLSAFIIVSAFIAYMVKRSRLQKVVLLVSSIPVAIICNIIRIVVTAILILLVNVEWADKFFHDFAGFVMMPAAVLIIFGELWLMNRLIEHEPQQQIVHKKKTLQKSSSKTVIKKPEKIEQPAATE